MAPSQISKTIAVFLAVICSANLSGFTQDEIPAVKFTSKLLTVDANEGIDLADINQDGKLDVVAGRNWYPAPEFAAHPLRLIEDWNGYVHSNGDFCIDVDKDGWIDVVAGAFIPTEVYWYKNPGADGLKLGKLWEQRLLKNTEISQNEASLLFLNYLFIPWVFLFVSK